MKRKTKKQRKILIISITLMFAFLVVGYSAFNTNINLKAKGNIKEGSRIIKHWNESSKEEFHSDFYKENVVSATFLNYKKVPKNAIESWDVSEKKDGSVIACVLESTLVTGKYDLYIGAKNRVIANQNSSFLFYDHYNLKEINFNNNLDTSNVTNMGSMFYGCAGLENVDLSSFDTSKVTNHGCHVFYVELSK